MKNFTVNFKHILLLTNQKDGLKCMLRHNEVTIGDMESIRRLFDYFISLYNLHETWRDINFLWIWNWIAIFCNNNGKCSC